MHPRFAPLSLPARRRADVLALAAIAAAAGVSLSKPRRVR